MKEADGELLFGPRWMSRRLGLEARCAIPKRRRSRCTYPDDDRPRRAQSSAERDDKPGAQPFRRFYEKLLEDPAWIIRTIHCGHDAMLDEPEEVVNILREVAEITLNTFDAAQGDKR